MLTPLVRLVSSRIRSLNRSTAFGAIRRFGTRALVKLNPRNFGSHRLAALYPDEVIAGILNRQGRKTATGERFTANQVGSLRRYRDIPRFQPSAEPLTGELVSIRKAAQILGMNTSSIHRWLADGFIAGAQVTPGAPWQIRITDELRASIVQQAPAEYLPMLETTMKLGVSRADGVAACKARRAASGLCAYACLQFSCSQTSSINGSPMARLSVSRVPASDSVPSADTLGAPLLARVDRSTLSPDSGTNGRSLEVSSTAFRTQPPNLQPVPLMDMGFAVIGPFARHRMPQIRFLYIGSYVCSTLLSDPASRRRPCASL